MCPYFWHFGVFVLVVLDGDCVGPMLLDWVFYLVQLLPDVVGGVVLWGRARVTAGLPPLPHTPVESRHQAADPRDAEHRAQQRDQEICKAGPKPITPSEWKSTNSSPAESLKRGIMGHDPFHNCLLSTHTLISSAGTWDFGDPDTIVPRENEQSSNSYWFPNFVWGEERLVQSRAVLRLRQLIIGSGFQNYQKPDLSTDGSDAPRGHEPNFLPC